MPRILNMPELHRAGFRICQNNSWKWMIVPEYAEIRRNICECASRNWITLLFRTWFVLETYIDITTMSNILQVKRVSSIKVSVSSVMNGTTKKKHLLLIWDLKAYMCIKYFTCHWAKNVNIYVQGCKKP